MKSLSAATVQAIISMLKAGYTVPKIVSSTGISHRSVYRIHSEHCPDTPKFNPGHPSKLSPTDQVHAVYLIRSGKAKTPGQAAKTLEDITNQSISTQTVHHCLKKKGLKAVVKKKKPFLKPRHRKARLDFAYAHKDWTVEDWKRVVWSDETKLNRFGSDGKSYAWVGDGEAYSDKAVTGTVKFGGGSLMMWGCMTWEGVGYSTRIDVRMDGDLYVRILQEELQETFAFYGLDPSEVIFQQDNDPKHTCKKAKEYFKTSHLQVLTWPAQSPDLNPIEHLWEHLKSQLALYEEPPKGMLELWERIEVEWDKIPKKVCQNLIESMPRRVAAVIKAKGGSTKY
jgi:transposase